MSTNKTSHFGLNQWEPGDQVRREEFNADNQKIDTALAKAGNCRMVTGKYQGTGGYGEGNSATGLDFADTLGKAPELLIVRASVSLGQGLVLPRGATECMYTLAHSVTTAGLLNARWTETGVSWWGRSAEYQFNLANTTYHYIAFG